MRLNIFISARRGNICVKYIYKVNPEGKEVGGLFCET
jgi:hypothetical protein